MNINAYISSHKDDMICMLRDLVEIDSASENIEGINQLARYLETRFKEAGLSVSRERQENGGDIVICQLNGSGKKTLVLGHFDTALPMGSVKENPFYIKEGKAYGPGVYDMKAGIVATLYAIQALLENGIQPNLLLIWNCDEETGSHFSRKTIARLAQGASRCLVMETGEKDGGIVTSRKGVGVFSICAKGIPAHAGAAPEKGRSAIEEICYKALAIQKLTNPANGIFANVGVISGGTSPSIIPEKAAIEVDVRISKRESSVTLTNQIKSIAESNFVPGVCSEWSGEFHRLPMEKTKETQTILDILLEQAREMGIELHEAASGGASDANLTSAMNIPTLCGMGPEGDHAHTKEEYLDLPTLFVRTELLARFLMKLYL